jgi:hypothetical protein
MIAALSCERSGTRACSLPSPLPERQAGSRLPGGAGRGRGSRVVESSRPNRSIRCSRRRRRTLRVAHEATSPSGSNRPGSNSRAALASSWVAGWCAALRTTSREMAGCRRSRIRPARSWAARRASSRTAPDRAAATTAFLVSGRFTKRATLARPVSDGMRAASSTDLSHSEPRPERTPLAILPGMHLRAGYPPGVSS